MIVCRNVEYIWTIWLRIFCDGNGEGTCGKSQYAYESDIMCKLTILDAICIAAYNRAKVAVIGCSVDSISVWFIISQDDILLISITVRDQQGSETRPVSNEFCGDVVCGQCVLVERI